MLLREVSSLQRNLDSLQQALGWTAEQGRQLVVKQPRILDSSPDTVQAAAAWLQQLFPDAEQLVRVVDRGPHLLSASMQHLRGNADYLRQALGWQDGDGQLVAYVAARPQDFALANLYGEAFQHKLRLLSEVVGVSTEECLTSGIGYLPQQAAREHRRTLHAGAGEPSRFVFPRCALACLWFVRLPTIETWFYRPLCCLQARAPHLLFDKAGKRYLGWIINPIRAGSTSGWPLPPISAQEAAKRHAAESEQRQQARAARGASKAAAMDDKQQGRGRRSKQPPAGDGGPASEGAS